MSIRMHSIFILVCCLALFYSNPSKAENQWPSILFSEPHDLATYDVKSEPSFDIKSQVEDETQSLPESPPSLTPTQEEETTLQSLVATPAENTSTSSSEEEELDQKNTWAIWDKDIEQPSGSNLANTNSTMPFTLTKSTNPQEPTSTPINQVLSASFESMPHSDANTLTNLNPTSLGDLAAPSSVKSSNAMIPTASQDLVKSTSEPNASSALPSANVSLPVVQSIVPTSSVTQIFSSARGDDLSSSSVAMSTGSDVIASSTQQLSGTTASSVPYPSLDSRPSNLTLPTTSLNSIPIVETSSLFDSKPKATYSDSSSIILSTASFSYSASSSLNATQTIISTTNTATLTSIGLQPLPTNGSTSIQTSTTVISSTAIYPSSTSSTLAPVTGNGTATSVPIYSTITIPLLTTTLPQQTSTSLSHNITYTPISLSNFTSSYYNSPTSTLISIKTTLSTVPSIIKPTATNTASTFIPSSIIAQTSSSRSSGQSSQTQATGIPSALPKIVQNPLSSSTPSQPVDTSEVQIGFQWALNYPFVVSHPLSTTQIFTYLPIGIADGLGLKPDQIVVKNLLPLDTTAELQFITTVARVFIPSSMVDTLRIELGIAASPIYQNPDESVNTLMNYINPAIPYFPGAVLDPGATPTGSDTKNTQSTTPADAGVFNSPPQQPQSPSAKGTTAGIAIAACGGAAAYGAAMFLLARRYKYRQQRQKRPKSIDYSSEPGEEFSRPTNFGNFGDAGALMSGGRNSPTPHDRHSRGSGRTGNTTRNAQISAPMMAENSLGWN
ncbi:putative basic proline-rich protein [Erysiphe neolycopersici]|uniref:Putative basic proline-rich protein n=1 Tax=Erysiphe neolycopersici TaxID=212602 RepID=A0A420HRD8_9PEZI|nr:putative basic proline-rich protein [Erysiphe neolycopersici]